VDFTNVVGNIPKDQSRKDVLLASLYRTRKSLMSIIGGLRQKDSSFFSLQKTARDFREFQSAYIKVVNGELYADSGGYSIIAGDVHPEDIPKFIACYTKFFELEHSSVDQFFSLDIPIFLKPEYQSFNTRKNILEFNKTSLTEAKQLLEDPLIRGKFNFVWHFKMLDQYQIWSNLYEELGLSDVIMRRSIGGMVGLPKLTGIRFAPFIALAYRCLLDHLEGAYPEETFHLHFLGIKSKTDRFAMALIQKLFTRYLDGMPAPAFTYDSINVNRNTQFNVRSLRVFSFADGCLEEYPGVFRVPADILKEVYFKASLKNDLTREMDNLKNGNALGNSDIFSPLGIYSEMAVDAYFAYIIESYEVAEIFFKSTSVIQVKHHIRNLLSDLSVSQPNLFTKNFKTTLIENVEWTFRFHDWFSHKRDRQNLHDLIVEFIEAINFPFELA